MRWLPAAALVLAACVDMDDSGSTIVGTSGDMETAPGDYAGYRVVTPCEDGHVHIGVIGTGTIAAAQNSELSAIGRELGESLRDVASIWGSAGYGLSCEPGVGTQIYTNNWRDVDGLIVRVGEFLRQRDLAIQVGIGVESIPVAQTN